MNTTTATLTIKLAGTITIDCKNLKPVFQALQIQPAIEIPVATNPNPAKPGESNFISEMQLLEKLTVCRRTLFLWRKSGKIPSVKIGRRVLFHWPSVEAALLRCQRGG